MNLYNLQQYRVLEDRELSGQQGYLTHNCNSIIKSIIQANRGHKLKPKQYI